VTLRARWVTLRARWVTLRARWVTLRARWVALRARWVTLRSRWVTLRARTMAWSWRGSGSFFRSSTWLSTHVSSLISGVHAKSGIHALSFMPIEMLNTLSGAPKPTASVSTRASWLNACQSRSLAG
jgi:hypothetical protein